MPGAQELRELDDDELESRLAEYRRELLNLRFQLATGQLDNVARLPRVRRDVARVLTVLRERDIDVAEAYLAAAERAPALREEAARRRAEDAAAREAAEAEAAAAEASEAGDEVDDLEDGDEAADDVDDLDDEDEAADDDEDADDEEDE